MTPPLDGMMTSAADAADVMGKPEILYRKLKDGQSANNFLESNH